MGGAQEFSEYLDEASGLNVMLKRRDSDRIGGEATWQA
jgi:hypothetical protein